MGFKFVLAVLVLVAALENKCQAGKGFGGGMGFGGSIGLVNQLRFQLVAAQQQIKLAEDTANTTIQNNIAAAQNSIDAELKQSQNKVDAAQNAACANQHKAAVSQVNSEAVTNCDQAAQFQAIELQVTLLNSIHAQIGGVYTLCPFWPPGNQVLCIQDFCLGVNTQITDQRDSILQAITTASSDAAKCIADESQKAHDAISAADAAFDECSAKPAAK